MKTDRLFVDDILNAIADILIYAEPGEAAFHGERMRQDAILRKITIIGEAAKRVSPITRALAPDVPWAQVCGMRTGSCMDMLASASDAYGKL